MAAAAVGQLGAAKPDPVIVRRLASHPVQGLAHRQDRGGLRVELPKQAQEFGLVWRHGPALLDSPADRAPTADEQVDLVCHPRRLPAELSAVRQQRRNARLRDGEPAMVQRQLSATQDGTGSQRRTARHTPPGVQCRVDVPQRRLADTQRVL